jgi:ketosteroid isomerase-like protein
MVNPDMMRDTVGKYFAGWAALDPVAVTACLDEKVVTHQPYGAAPLTGRAAVREFLVRVFAAFEHLEVRPDNIFVAKDRVAVQFAGRGTGRNGRHIRLDGITVFEFTESGTIRALWGYWDPEAILAQLRS